MAAVVERPMAWRHAGLIAAVAMHTLVLTAVLWPVAEPDTRTHGRERIGAANPLRVSLLASERPSLPGPVPLLVAVPAAVLPPPVWLAVPALPEPVPRAASQSPSQSASPSPPPSPAAAGEDGVPVDPNGGSPSPDVRARLARVERAAAAPDQDAPLPRPDARAAPSPRPIAARADRRDCPTAGYPAPLRSRGIEGTVQLRVQVGRDGRAAAVQLVQGSGFRLLDQAAMAQARGCRFEPASLGSEPVESWVEFPVHFRLQVAA
jgi:protein TonB